MERVTCTWSCRRLTVQSLVFEEVITVDATYVDYTSTMDFEDAASTSFNWRSRSETVETIRDHVKDNTVPI